MAPKINEELRKVIVKKGELAELLCDAVGIPKPEITWLKDNKTLTDSKFVFFFSNPKMMNINEVLNIHKKLK